MRFIKLRLNEDGNTAEFIVNIDYIVSIGETFYDANGRNSTPVQINTALDEYKINFVMQSSDEIMTLIDRAIQRENYLRK